MEKIEKVKFTDPETQEVVEFIVEDEDLNADEEHKSINLWGAGAPDSSIGNLNQWAPEYKINQLNNVSFSARKNGGSLKSLISFEITIYTFQSSNFTLTFSLTNTASIDKDQNIVGSFSINKKNYSSYQFHDASNPNDPDNIEFIDSVDVEGGGSDSKYYTIVIHINPIKYYKRVLFRN